MQVTATEAKNRFGNLCYEAKCAPIDTLALRKKEFAEIYKDWIAAYNADIEKNELWCDEQTVWNVHV